MHEIEADHTPFEFAELGNKVEAKCVKRAEKGRDKKVKMDCNKRFEEGTDGHNKCL
jgi:hypothetical protein